MANTVLQVKRSATTAIPVSLANGELAYSGNSSSNSLFIGHPDGSTGVIRIAGGKYPYLHQATVGILTANAVVVTDSNAFVSNVFTTGLFVAASIDSPAANSTAALITSITPQANTTQLGASAGGSNTELVTSYAIKTYVDGKVATASINTAAAYTFTGVHTYNANVNIVGNTTAILSVGTTTNVSINAIAIAFTNATATVTINATSYGGTANSATYLGSTDLTTLQGQITGNAATAYTNATSYADTKAATAYTNATAYADTKAATAYTNATAYADTKAATAYSNAVANAAALYQTTAGLSANVATLTANAAGYLGNSSGTIGNITSWITGNSATAYTNATTYVTTGGYTISGVVTYSGNVVLSSGNGTNEFLIGTINATSIGLLANSTVLTIGNSTVNTVINSTAFSGTANNSTNFGGLSLTTVQAQITGNAATAYTNATSYADTKAATAYSNATAYASNASNITTGTLPAAQLPANVVFWSNNNTFTGIQTFDNVVINGNTALGNATTDVITITARANTSIVPSANVTYDLGTTALYWRDVLAGNGKFDTVTTTGNLTVGGNINVTGNLITQNVSSVIISDPIIYLAGNNYTSDVVDIGFAANYSPDGVQELHTGLIRKNSTDNYYLFVGSTQELSGNNLVNTNATGFRSATLYSYLNSGALTSSNTALNITANASIAVAFTANTLALSTALPATSGGTGQASFAVGDILYASSTTALSKLARGTDGQVLQMQGTTLAWASLDGGTF